LREEIGKSKETDKDLMFIKINEKIESLENIVKNAINDMNTVKE
jgi:hypothetical protein